MGSIKVVVEAAAQREHSARAALEESASVWVSGSEFWKKILSIQQLCARSRLRIGIAREIYYTLEIYCQYAVASHHCVRTFNTCIIAVYFYEYDRSLSHLSFQVSREQNRPSQSSP